MFKQVAIVGHCLILAHTIGNDPYTGAEIPGFFAVFMITKNGKPGCCLAETSDLVRITHNKSTCADLIGFCQGYSAACQDGRRTTMPHEWRFRETIDPSTVTVPTADERDRLRAWTGKEQPA